MKERQKNKQKTSECPCVNLLLYVSILSVPVFPLKAVIIISQPSSSNLSFAKQNTTPWWRLHWWVLTSDALYSMKRLLRTDKLWIIHLSILINKAAQRFSIMIQEMILAWGVLWISRRLTATKRIELCTELKKQFQCSKIIDFVFNAYACPMKWVLDSRSSTETGSSYSDNCLSLWTWTINLIGRKTNRRIIWGQSAKDTLHIVHNVSFQTVDHCLQWEWTLGQTYTLYHVWNKCVSAWKELQIRTMYTLCKEHWQWSL